MVLGIESALSRQAVTPLRSALAMMNTSFLRYTIPWYFPEVEETIRLMGQDFWPYGADPNRKVVETLVRYVYEQGLTSTVLDIDGMFAAKTLKLFKI
jgi:4,5-dihydroxyphthalate decarboxylase